MIGKKITAELRDNLKEPAKQMGLAMTMLAGAFVIMAIAILIMAVK
jgi:hypothetical protein